MDLESVIQSEVSHTFGALPIMWILAEGITHFLQFEATNQMLMIQASSVAGMQTCDKASSIICTRLRFWLETNNAFKSETNSEKSICVVK